MKFAVYGENVTINDSMREVIETRLSNLNKYVVIDESQSAKVTVKVYGGNALKVEVGVPSKVGLLRAEVVHDDFSNAIDLAIDKIEDQIRRNKGRLSRRHKDSIAESFYVEDSEVETPVRTKTLYAEEMVLDEAITQMEMLSHSFFIYKDVDSDKIAVVYKRNNGGYGLIEVRE